MVGMRPLMLLVFLAWNASGCASGASRGQEAVESPTVQPVVTEVASPEIMASRDATCYRRPTGELLCWGAFPEQLMSGSYEPILYEKLQWAAGIAIGEGHLCALRSTGEVVCRGSNHTGQLGIGDEVESSDAFVDVAGLANVVDIGAGENHTCALRRDGHVLCWGINFNGEVGSGGDGIQRRPVLLDEVSDAVALAVGESHTCALSRGGRIQCWGQNGGGQSGWPEGLSPPPESEFPNDDFDYRHRWPRTLQGVTDVTHVDVRGAYSCALSSNGSVRCWGKSRCHRRPDADSDRWFTLPEQLAWPREIDGVSDASHIAVGRYAACALGGDGRVSCWTQCPWTPDPQRPGEWTLSQQEQAEVQDGIDDAVELVAGLYHFCALLRDGGVRCWGEGRDGQLGIGRGVRVRLPAVVEGLDDVVELAAGGFHTCARRSSGVVLCWGANSQGQLGDATYVERGSPAAVIGLLGVVDLDAASTRSCGLLGDGAVMCWGGTRFYWDFRVGDLPEEFRSGHDERFLRFIFESPESPPPPTAVDGAVGAVEIALGGTHSCLRQQLGNVWCWGLNLSGQLVLGEESTGSSPVGVGPVGGGLQDADEIELGRAHICARRRSGEVLCWGRNEYGQLGDGTMESRSTPTPVPGVLDAVELALGQEHSCLRRRSGEVLCWGLNDHGQLGDGTTTSSSSPVEVSGLSEVVAITAGAAHTCAIRRGGQLLCWGANMMGELGIETLGDIRIPTRVPLEGEVLEVVGGETHGCARLATGEVTCWGDGVASTLGRFVSTLLGPRPVGGFP